MDELLNTVNAINSHLQDLERNLVAPLCERTLSLEAALRSVVTEDVAVQTASLESCEGRKVCPLDDLVEGAGSPVTSTGTVDPSDIASSPDVHRFIFHRVGSCPELRSCASSVPRLPADPVSVSPSSCVPHPPVDSSLRPSVCRLQQSSSAFRLQWSPSAC